MELLTEYGGGMERAAQKETGLPHRCVRQSRFVCMKRLGKVARNLLSMV
ncbi:hypothetical protein HMPREF9162_0833 [Selenomonas sp. oral taxon 137 str. F0430]|nr:MULTISPECIES: hypothetical protein [unclassified Selenomonas]EFR41432.1 hypothetical protein HMPREF9162_0833 [Selenomonas sp. oral taxon 137 str. F0430]EJP30167.1 hypothetical protein HMPREF1147_2130 [Selenomonas sp. FOBRC9]